MVMKNPLSQMGLSEINSEAVPILSPNVKEVLNAIPLVSQVETSTTLLAAERETRNKRAQPSDIQPLMALEAERKRMETAFTLQLDAVHQQYAE